MPETTPQNTNNPTGEGAQLEALKASHAAELSSRDRTIAEQGAKLEELAGVLESMKKATAQRDGDIESLMTMEREATAKARGELDESRGKVQALETSLSSAHKATDLVRLSYSVAAVVGLDASVVEPLMGTMGIEDMARTPQNVEQIAKSFRGQYPSLFTPRDMGPTSTPGGDRNDDDVVALAKQMSRGGRGATS
ncbi:MAG: hypothetical protein AAGF11_54485 [Myxococcota bacterium]